MFILGLMILGVFLAPVLFVLIHIGMGEFYRARAKRLRNRYIGKGQISVGDGKGNFTPVENLTLGFTSPRVERSAWYQCSVCHSRDMLNYIRCGRPDCPDAEQWLKLRQERT